MNLSLRTTSQRMLVCINVIMLNTVATATKTNNIVV